MYFWNEYNYLTANSQGNYGNFNLSSVSDIKFTSKKHPLGQISNITSRSNINKYEEIGKKKIKGRKKNPRDLQRL